ncbi:hypothetical protein OOJ09_07155 [Mesorhizobium qingshengii]|uniref:Uncharacterized protein n=1 Tax=Mesorhizobium qingshengii TaxID=1165689 RepID=A0ABT4QQW1_9HYPH|nr:hypothetical protein [Mesorhizobium qingshengii]MCZ8543950.1 hypothetical protein [Mesorhizobium qingshengii]
MVYILTWVTLICGLVSAILWWASSYFSIQTVERLDAAMGDEGDIAFEITDNKTTIFKIRRTARINSAAAFFAGLSVAAQALTAISHW